MNKHFKLILASLMTLIFTVGCGAENTSTDNQQANTAEVVETADDVNEVETAEPDEEIDQEETTDENVEEDSNTIDEDDDTATDKAPIKVATSPTFAPASYKDDDGNLVGFEIALMEEIGKRTGREIEWVEASDMDNLFGNLDAGKADTIAFQISITDERKENYDFSDVYGVTRLYMCVREDFKYDTLDDMQGKKVLCPPTHSFYNTLEEYNETQPDDKKIEIITAEGGSLYDDLEMERIDGFPITEVAFQTAMEEHDYKLKLSGDEIEATENAYPFRKDTDKDIVDDINKALKEIKEDGTLEKLYMEYYKIDLSPDK